MQGNRRKLGAGVVGLLGLASVALSCASLPVNLPPGEQPARVKPPRDASGHILFNAFDKALAPYIKNRVHKAKRPCPPPSANCEIPFDVQEVGQSYDIYPANGPGGYRIIAILVNRDINGTIEPRYHLLPAKKYYVWVDDAPASTTVQSKTRWGFIEEGNDTPIDEGYVIKCHNEPPNDGVSYVDFEYCESSPTRDVGYSPAPVANRKASILSFASHDPGRRAREMMAAGETWFECDPGCCTGTTAKQ